MRDALTAGPQHAAKAVPPTVAPAAANVAKSVGVTSYSSAVITWRGCHRRAKTKRDSAER